MIMEMLLDGILFRDGWLGFICSLLLIVCAVAVLWLIAWGIYVAADSWWVIPQRDTATVVSHGHRAAWTQVNMVTVGKTTVPQIINHPERWWLTLKLSSGKCDDVDVSESTHNRVQEGRKCNVEFKEGRLSGDPYVLRHDL